LVGLVLDEWYSPPRFNSHLASPTMRPAAHVQATIELLDDLDERKIPADRLMAGDFKQRRYIGSKDKAAISEQFYQVLRQKLSLSYLLEQADLQVSNRLLLAILLKANGSSIEANFNGDKFSPKPLKSEQLSILRGVSLTDLSVAPMNIQLNVPEWISHLLENALDDQFEIEMRASNQRAATDIRVNLLKSSRDQVAQVLKSTGHEFKLSELSPWAIRFTSRVALFGLDAFREGWFEVQDEGSQLLALLTNVEAGQKVVDFCAGAGGKTLALAAMMRNKGTIYACDVHSKRLEQLSKRTRRAGAHNVRTHVLSSEHDKWVKQHAGVADLVLLDAPCTGTGTWRRSPDSRWNLKPENLTDLVALQASILDSASRLVKPGARMFYATCSLLKEENEQQIEAFLERNKNFKPAALSLPKSLTENLDRIVVDEYQLRTFPALTGSDGFYVASLERVE